MIIRIILFIFFCILIYIIYYNQHSQINITNKNAFSFIYSDSKYDTMISLKHPDYKIAADFEFNSSSFNSTIWSNELIIPKNIMFKLYYKNIYNDPIKMDLILSNLYYKRLFNK